MAAQTLAMFPGQGSQFVGMGREVLQEFADARLAFEEAEDAARVRVRKLCLDGPEDELRLTANTQVCILTLSVAIWRVLQAETGWRPDAFAGHSLGEYSALVAAGRLPLGRAADLVRRRGEAMQAAVPAGLGAMAAVLNAPADELKEACARLSRPGQLVEVVNYNSPQQLVVAGHKPAVEALARELEAKSVRSVLLPVSAPFHSSLMQPAREAMRPHLAAGVLQGNDTRIIANLTGRHEPDYGPTFLIEQISSPVLWTQTLQTAWDLGCEAAVEVGPGKVLWGLARRTWPKSAKLWHTEQLRKTIDELA